jgi:hypothetical protein
MALWPEQGTEAGVDWDAYRRATARPGSLTEEEQAKARDSEEVAKEPPRRVPRSSEV